MKNTIFFFLALTGALSYGQNNTIDALVADFERGKALSLAYIEAMPEDKFNFSPDEEALSFAKQMLHMAQGTAGLASNGTGTERLHSTDLTADEKNHTKAEVRRITEESFDYVINAIKAMDPASFDEIVERGPFKVSRIGWVHKAKEHLNHHRGQTAVYLRLAGVKPPEYKLF